MFRLIVLANIKLHYVKILKDEIFNAQRGRRPNLPCSSLARNKEQENAYSSSTSDVTNISVYLTKSSVYTIPARMSLLIMKMSASCISIISCCGNASSMHCKAKVCT